MAPAPWPRSDRAWTSLAGRAEAPDEVRAEGPRARRSSGPDLEARSIHPVHAAHPRLAESGLSLRASSRLLTRRGKRRRFSGNPALAIAGQRRGWAWLRGGKAAFL